MRIILLRHGAPKIERDLQLSASEFGRWVSDYNAAGIDDDCRPPPCSIEQANRCAFVVCSDLPRSLASARALGVDNIGAGESLFREMSMPHANWPFPRLPLPLWPVFFRLLWALGYSANAEESFKQARGRARACSERLAELASEHGTVLLVGHGSLNWFIARHLKKMGWSGPNKSPRKYWTFAVYSDLGALAAPDGTLSNFRSSQHAGS